MNTGDYKDKIMSIISNYFKQNRVAHTFLSCQWPIGDPQEKEFHFCDASHKNVSIRV